MKRIIVLVVLIVAFFFFTAPRSDGGGATSPTSVTTSPTPRAGSSPEAPRASGSLRALAAGSPGATPDPDVPPLLTAAVADIGTVRPMRIQFTGSDASGSVAFDVLVDGIGDLRGTYTRQGATAEIILVRDVLYMRGAAAVTSFTGIPIDPSVTTWIRIPAWPPPGILDTIATPQHLRACVQVMIDTGEPFTAGTAVAAGGGRAVPFTRYDPDHKWPAEYVVAAAGAAHLLTWQYLPISAYPQHAECNGGVEDQGGPPSGPTGTFTFSAFDQAVAPIAAPPGAIAPPYHGGAPSNDTGPT